MSVATASRASADRQNPSGGRQPPDNFAPTRTWPNNQGADAPRSVSRYLVGSFMGRRPDFLALADPKVAPGIV